MLHLYHVGKIRRPVGRVGDVTFVFSDRLWDSGHNGSLWVHPSVVINILPISGNINTTIQTYEGEVVTITVYLSGILLEVEDGWFNSMVRVICCVIPEWVHNTYQVFYVPSYLNIWQQDLNRLFRTCHMIPSDTVLKYIGRH